MTIVGDGNQSRDFVYVTDVANAFYLASETEIDSQIFNLGASNPQSILKLAKLIGGPIEFLPKRPGEPDCTHANITKITNLLKWSPKITFEEGLELMLKEIDKWKDAPLWNRQTIDKATKNWFKYMSKK